MSKFTKFTINSVVLTAAIAASAVVSGAAQAQTSPEKATDTQSAITSNESTMIREVGRDPLIRNTQTTAQNVTSVSQLSDVKPTDWAFTALQSLVERYGCIAGYPDRTYRGQRAMTRYEFAAGLNACLDKINELISSGLADKVSKADLAALQKLQEEFAAELATLRGRVDALEAKTAKLEAQQFSTTTKLNATAIFAPIGTSGNRGNANSNVTFAGRVRLNFDTSFTGRDLLRTRLQAGNVNNLASATGTNMSRLAFDTNTGNGFELDKFYYRFPLGSQLTAFIGANALNADDVLDTVNPYFESSDNGAISRFGRYDPLLFRGPGSAGAALIFRPADQFSVRAFYLAGANSNTPNPASTGVSSPIGQGGLTGGAYIAGAQITFAPSKDFKIGAVYERSFEPGSIVALSSSTGSGFGNAPFGATDTSADRYGAQVSWRVVPGLALGGWVGFANARQESGVGIGNNANLFNWSANLAFPDLFGEGNLGGIIFGQQPRVTSNSIAARADKDTSYHLELLYRWRISKNISITPGAFVIFNPNHNNANDAIWVGTIRTTFTF